MSDSNNLIRKIRQQFPILSQKVNGQALIYLDNAATTQKPRQVINCLQEFYRTSNANVHRASHALSADATQKFEHSREIVADFLNARSSKEILWTRGTTEAINLVANSWGQSLKAGDEIILSTLEHHANIVPWQLLADRTDCVIKVIPILESGDLDIDAFTQLLSKKTRLVAISHASNALGTINPVKEIIRLSHLNGTLVLVDGAQALPHFKVDVQDLDADFYVFSGHKLFAPSGIGVLYGKQEILEQMPPWQGGGEMIERVSFSGTTFNQLPFKFEAGTPNIAGVIGLAEAINWLTDQERQILEQHEQALLNTAIECCEQIKGFQRIGKPQQSVSLLSFTLEDQHQQDIGLLLDQQGIAVRTGHHCAMPLMQELGVPGTTRASFAFYNTLDEVESFVEALDKATSPVTFAVNSSITGLNKKLLTLQGWNARYRELMIAGKQLTALPASKKTSKNLVKGCESNTWLSYDLEPDGKIHFAADSEARIIRGLLALVLDIFNNKTAAEIREIDIDETFSQLELQRHLSPSRGNGLKAVIDKIYLIASTNNITEQQ